MYYEKQVKKCTIKAISVLLAIKENNNNNNNNNNKTTKGEHIGRSVLIHRDVWKREGCCRILEIEILKGDQTHRFVYMMSSSPGSQPFMMQVMTNKNKNKNKNKR